MLIRVTSPEMSMVVDNMFGYPDTDCFPSPAQQAVLREHCGHARYVWNLAVEQHRHWHREDVNCRSYSSQPRDPAARS